MPRTLATLLIMLVTMVAGQFKPGEPAGQGDKPAANPDAGQDGPPGGNQAAAEAERLGLFPDGYPTSDKCLNCRPGPTSVCDNCVTTYQPYTTYIPVQITSWTETYVMCTAAPEISSCTP
ncbi:uncharacterized protein BJX67DRAFT_382981 [Aspergillus lucknowensis]|uniref:Uncharacterized protein n=1 Tax=Aspergillus lucknowensis TaxID=176173 RepID=A0ABR4LL13_9EURO